MPQRSGPKQKPAKPLARDLSCAACSHPRQSASARFSGLSPCPFVCPATAVLVAFSVACAKSPQEAVPSEGSAPLATVAQPDQRGTFRALIPMFVHEDEQTFSIAPAKGGEAYAADRICVYEVTWRLRQGAPTYLVVLAQEAITKHAIYAGNIGLTDRDIRVRKKWLSDHNNAPLQGAAKPLASGPVLAETLDTVREQVKSTAVRGWMLTCPETLIDPTKNPQHRKLLERLSRVASKTAK